MCVVRSARPSRTDAELLAACALCVGAPGRLVGSGNARILAFGNQACEIRVFLRMLVGTLGRRDAVTRLCTALWGVLI